MVRWLRWHCPPDTGFEIRALAVWGRARYLSVTEAPHNTNFHTWMGKKQFCFFQTAETGNRTPDSGVKGSGANHYPRAPAQRRQKKKVNPPVCLQEMFWIITSRPGVSLNFTREKGRAATEFLLVQPPGLPRARAFNRYFGTWKFA